jgi:uncharacterized small protein (DUF1192 family)
VDGATADRPLVGLFGAFDTGDLGEVALRRVLERELLLRRPDIDVVALAPFGAERPIPGDEGRPAMPLPLLAGGAALDLDALVITGDVLGDDGQWADRYPVPVEAIAERGVAALALTGKRGGAAVCAVTEWFAVGAWAGDVDLTGVDLMHVWPRDPGTLERFGDDPPPYPGDPLLLAGRVFRSETVHRRTELLRMCGALPTGRWMVIETGRGLAGSPSSGRLTDAVAVELRADPNVSAVIVTLNPTTQSLDSIVRVPGLIAERVHRLPMWVGLDDIVAAMSGAAAVVATTSAGAHMAASLGVPVAAFDIEETHRFSWAIPMISVDAPRPIQALLAANDPAAIDSDVRNLDGTLTALALRLPQSAASSRPAMEADAAHSALAVLQQRLVDERTALQAELSRLQAELEHLQASPEHRIARPIREGYQRWQRRRT